MSWKEGVKVDVKVGDEWTDDATVDKTPPLNRFLRDWDRTEYPVEIKVCC